MNFPLFKVFTIALFPSYSALNACSFINLPLIEEAQVIEEKSESDESTEQVPKVDDSDEVKDPSTSEDKVDDNANDEHKDA